MSKLTREDLLKMWSDFCSDLGLEHLPPSDFLEQYAHVLSDEDYLHVREFIKHLA